jgi:hypothetical protein
MKVNPLKFAALVVGLLMVPACNAGPLAYPGIFEGSAGSCTYPEADGYVTCQDFLGTDYSEQLGQSLCANVSSSAHPDAVAASTGTWSQNACPTAGTLGICVVVPDGSGDSQTFQYTYTALADPDSGVTATALDAKTACGVSGGVFTAAQ